MHAHAAVLTASVLLAVGLAGCASDAGEVLDDATGALDGAAVPGSWSMDFANCREGGFIASSFQPGAPWQRADIRPEIGPDWLMTERTGNWHNGLQCEHGVFNGAEVHNFHFGYVGPAILPPEWDHGGADRHFVLAGLGLPDSPMRDAMLDTINADISRAVASTVTWLYEDLVKVEYADQDKGQYGGHGIIQPYRESVPERTTRLWWVVPANGERIIHDHHGGELRPEVEGGFHPVWWDMHTTSGPQWSSPGDRMAWTTHTGTADHGSGEGVDRNVGEINSVVVYDYPTVSLEFGGVVESVTLEREWVH